MMKIVCLLLIAALAVQIEALPAVAPAPAAPSALPTGTFSMPSFPGLPSVPGLNSTGNPLGAIQQAGATFVQNGGKFFGGLFAPKQAVPTGTQSLPSLPSLPGLNSTGNPFGAIQQAGATFVQNGGKFIGGLFAPKPAVPTGTQSLSGLPSLPGLNSTGNPFGAIQQAGASFVQNSGKFIGGLFAPKPAVPTGTQTLPGLPSLPGLNSTGNPLGAIQQAGTTFVQNSGKFFGGLFGPKV